jgi:hypothetical protein
MSAFMSYNCSLDKVETFNLFNLSLERLIDKSADVIKKGNRQETQKD